MKMHSLRRTLAAGIVGVGIGLTALVAQPSQPAMANGYHAQLPYAGDCQQRPPGTVCIGYADGYVWLVRDSIVGWDRFASRLGTVQVARGVHADYAHVLDTSLVSVTPK